LCEKCDDIITCAGSGHHLRPDRIESGAPYFGTSLPVRPLSLPEFLRWCLLSRRLWFVVCFGKFPLSDISIRNNQAPSAKWQRSAERRVRQETDWLAGGQLLRVATIRRTTDISLFISHTMNLLLFKFGCNIFVGVRIIKEMPGSVACGTPCTKFIFCKGKGKAISLQASYRTIAFQKVESPRFLDNRHTKVVRCFSPTHRPPLPLVLPGTHFYYRLS